MPTLYRPNVAAILQNAKGKILVCERLKPDGAWQFPQGGVDKGESHLEALYRELEEEIGVKPDLYEVTEERGGYRYDFADGRLKFGKYGGQEQTYYLCQFTGKKGDIEIDTDHPEFQDMKWIRPEEFDIKAVPKFKRAVYRQVFIDFFNVNLTKKD